MVGLRRLELPTSRLSGVRSNQLSYKPIKIKLYMKIALSQAIIFFLPNYITESIRLIPEASIKPSNNNSKNFALICITIFFDISVLPMLPITTATARIGTAWLSAKGQN